MAAVKTKPIEARILIELLFIDISKKAAGSLGLASSLGFARYSFLARTR